MLTHLDNLSSILPTDPANRQHPLNSGRVSWWLTVPGMAGGRMFYDLTGQNHGTLTNMTSAALSGWRSTARPGGYGAIQCDGAAARVVVASAASLQLTNAVTCAVWAMTTSAGIFNRILLSKDGSERAYTLDINANTARFYINGGTVIAIGSINLPANVWNHLVGTYDGTTIRIYVNGVLDASGSGSVAINTGTSTVQMGGRELDGSVYPGQIDDASIWNRALSAREIRELFTLSRQGYPGVLNRMFPRTLSADAGGPGGIGGIPGGLAIGAGRLMIGI